MSKLFDTLEKIRRQETYHVPKMPGAFQEHNHSGANRNIKRLVVVAVSGTVLLAAASIFLVLHLLNDSGSKTPGKISTGPEPVGQNSSPAMSAQGSLTSPAGQPQTDRATSPPVIQASTPKATRPDEQIAAWNNLGVEAIRAKQDYWKGIYLFNLARDKDPGRIEPLINMAVALNELGLTGTADRYLAEARALDPGHPALQRNLDILARAGHPEATLKLLTP